MIFSGVRSRDEFPEGTCAGGMRSDGWPGLCSPSSARSANSPASNTDIGEIPLPPDYQEKTEWAFARLMFPPGGRSTATTAAMPTGTTGYSLWTQDFPRADRHFSLAVRRLTRIHARSVGAGRQPRRRRRLRLAVAVRRAGGRVGTHRRAGPGVARIPAARRLLHGRRFPRQRSNGTSSRRRIKRAFPDREIRDIPDDDPIFHTVYDLNERVQIPGQAHLRTGLQGSAVPDRPGGRQGRALARHLRRPGPHHDRHLVQFRRRRCLGVCRRRVLPGASSPTWPSAWASTTSCTR